MRKWTPIFMLLALIAAFFVVDRVLGFELNRRFYHSEFRYAKLYRGGMKNDVVILGNSRGKAYYVPYMDKTLGVSCFNLSYDSMDLTTAATLFADYLDHNATPKMVIVELSCMLDENEAHAGSIKVFFPVSERFRETLRQQNKTNWELCRAVHLYRYNSEFFLRAMSVRGSDQGWVNTEVVSPAIFEAIRNGHKMADAVPPRETFQALAALLRIAQERGVEVRFVMNPYLREYVGDYQLPDYSAWLREATGIDAKVWDYRMALDDHKLFSDSRHINVDGSRVLIDQQLREGFYAPVMPDSTCKVNAQ